MTTIKQLSFAGGELAPAFYARTDMVKFATGLRTCRNGMVLRHGGVANRPGTEFITEVKDSTKRVKLIPFVFNAAQTYILEFGNLYMRVIKDGVLLPAGGPVYEIVTTYVEADLQELHFAQSADVVTITHPNYPPRELKRLGDVNWTLTTITFAPEIGTPTGVNVAGSSPGANYDYQVTAIDAETFEESLAGSGTGANLRAPSAADHTITWNPVVGAGEYNVYLAVNGVPGYIGTAIGTSFVNDGLPPDLTDTPPIPRNPFVGANNYPSTVSYYQQRLMFANTNNNPETVWGSRVGLFKNFTVSSPFQDDDAVTFTLVGRQVNAVRSLLELVRLVVFSAGAEYAVGGDEAGILKPTDINSRQHSLNGSGTLMPVMVGGNALYVQARGAIVRDLGFDITVDGYKGNDLTIFSDHLFNPLTITDWAYQQIPNSIIWAVRSDGVLLGLTYVREHQIWAWHRHDTLGTYENVAAVPEGTEDVPYVVARRLIDGTYVRYIERSTTRTIDPDAIEDSVFMDSSLSYDGRNPTPSHTMTLTGGPPWAHSDLFTLTSSVGAYFGAGDVGNAMHLYDSTGDVLRCEITAHISGTQVTVRPHKDVPASMQGTALAVWTKAVDELSGLDHLEGENVSVFADGFVVANPNNPDLVTITVSSGAITLPRPHGVIHVGLPYLMDLETLDIDTVQGETLIDKKKLITKVALAVEASRGIFVGARAPTGTDPTNGLREAKLRSDETYDKPVALLTGVVNVPVKGEWNDNGRVFVRQIDPVPLSVLAVAPAGLVPFRG